MRDLVESEENKKALLLHGKPHPNMNISVQKQSFLFS